MLPGFQSQPLRFCLRQGVKTFLDSVSLLIKRQCLYRSFVGSLCVGSPRWRESSGSVSFLLV